MNGGNALLGCCSHCFDFSSLMKCDRFDYIVV